MADAPKPRAYVLLSGGKDSVTTAHYLAAHDMLAGCVAIDTGITVPEWEPFIRDLCAAQGWPLEIVSTSVSYEWLVLRFGFPGPGMHSIFMRWLKERGIDVFRKRHPGALLASGVRKGESQRRFGTVREWNVLGKMVVWAPLIDWTTEETWAYMRAHNLPRSPVYATLGVSGDCLCGAFASKGEREAIADCHPAVDARLCALERDVKGRWGQGRTSRGRTTRGEQLICVECDPSGTPESGTRGTANAVSRSASARDAD
ncbi:MAG TPA: phosphoadenosine phosphosulfate reductase family protein [Terriglobales bacterium]|nr:phosphoadenosine phosphosulfate reductase family protein [Terriglobales bacterium]